MARAKSRAWRGLTTATGRPTTARAAAAGISRPPVASNTMSAGASGRTRSTKAAMPASSFAALHCSPPGRVATSSRAFAMSIPM